MLEAVAAAVAAPPVAAAPPAPVTPPVTPPAVQPLESWTPIGPDYPIQFDLNGTKTSKPVGELVKAYEAAERTKGIDPAKYQMFVDAFEKNDQTAVETLYKTYGPKTQQPVAPAAPPTPLEQQVQTLLKQQEALSAQLQRVMPVHENIVQQGELSQVKEVLTRPEQMQKYPLLAKAPQGPEMVYARFNVLRQSLGEKANDPQARRQALEYAMGEINGFISGLAPVFAQAPRTNLLGLLDDQAAPGMPTEELPRFVPDANGVLYDRMSPAYQQAAGAPGGAVPAVPVTPPTGPGVGMAVPAGDKPMTTGGLMEQMRSRRGTFGQ